MYNYMSLPIFFFLKRNCETLPNHQDIRDNNK